MKIRTLITCFVLVALSFSSKVSATNLPGSDTIKPILLPTSFLPEFNGPTHEVGVNATRFISYYLSFTSGFITSTEPFLVTYKYHMKGQALRFGVGGYSFKENEHKGQPSSVNLHNGSFDVRLGYERRKTLGKRFTAYGGADLSYGTQRTENRQVASGDRRVLNDYTGTFYRASAMGGISFKIKDQIAIQTESRLTMEYSERFTETKYINYPGIEDRSRNDYRRYTQFWMPTDIYLVVFF